MSKIRHIFVHDEPLRTEPMFDGHGKQTGYRLLDAEPAPKKYFKVTLKYQFPAYDEKEGLDFGPYRAENKAKAIEMARREAYNGGHTVGRGRTTFTAEEVEAPRHFDDASAWQLWKYDEITGYWKLGRTVTPETSQHWLAVFRSDDPKGHYVVSQSRPNWDPRKSVR